MPFNVNREATTSGFQANCGLNCLVHAICNNLNYIDGFGGMPDLNHDGITPFTENNQQVLRVNPIDDPNEGLLRHFRAYYGINASFTKADLLQFLGNINNPYHRELVLGPVLRNMLPSVFRNRYRDDHDHVMNGNLTAEEREHKRKLGTPGEHLSATEVQYLAHYFGIKLESYERDDLNKDTLAATAGQLQQRQNSNDRSRGHFAFPVANPPIIKMRNPGSHWSYEIEANKTAEELRAHNAFYQNRKQLDEKKLRDQIKAALDAGKAANNVAINLDPIVAQSEAQNISTNNFNLFGKGQGAGALAVNFMNAFRNIPVVGPVLSYFGGLFGGIIEMIFGARDIIEGMESKRDIGREFDTQEIIQSRDASDFHRHVRKLDPEERAEHYARWRQNPNSNDCWDILNERLIESEHEPVIRPVAKDKGKAGDSGNTGTGTGTGTGTSVDTNTALANRLRTTQADLRRIQDENQRLAQEQQRMTQDHQTLLQQNQNLRAQNQAQHTAFTTMFNQFMSNNANGGQPIIPQQPNNNNNPPIAPS